MDFIELLENEYLSIIFGSLGGIFAALITQKALNKRGLFSYLVNHNRVGMSSQDLIFGDVTVKWNGSNVDHLYLSTIDLKNESLNDYENVIISTYTNNTKLLTESTQIKDTPNILKWTESFQAQMAIQKGNTPTDTQLNLHRGGREYLVPVFNRGQQIRITYLNAANTSETPAIWLSTTIKGVKVKFQVPQNQIYGVPQPRAALAGIFLGLFLLIPLVLNVSNNWVIALAAISYGLLAQLPGAFIIKTYRKARDFVGG